MAPIFLTIDDVLLIHEDQIQRYGGMDGVRDLSLVESAVAQACATFESEYLHPDLFEMAAAYLFHLVKNHAFLDGNKRTGAATALVFLYLNGCTLEVDEDELADLVLAVAAGNTDKREIAVFLRTAANLKPKQ